MKNELIINALDQAFPNPKCELEYNKDYELLIAVMLSAQCTDKRVNSVTHSLFANYTLAQINDLSTADIQKLIRSLGSFHKKSIYMKQIASSLLKGHNGVVPNDREYLESLPGVGRKTCNVVLSELFDVPTIAVDTHVERVSKRFGFVSKSANVMQIEKALMKRFKPECYNRINHQLLLYGRYICKAKKPLCNNCMLKEFCKHKKSKE